MYEDRRQTSPEVKQLRDDFQVLEYLNFNQNSSQNIQSYLQFIDQIRLSKTRKTKTLGEMVKQVQSLAGENHCAPRIQDKTVDQIHIRCHHETETKGDLAREVEECKKSIVGLLRGDIGHIVKRNETEKLLSSKINKVEIIALDQCQKVNSELFKEKEEIKELKMMRGNFVQKLREASRVEHNGLIRTEHYYVHLLGNHREVQNKLSEIQRNGTMIGEYVEMRRNTQKKNSWIATTVQFLNRLVTSFPLDSPLDLSDMGRTPEQVVSNESCILMEDDINTRIGNGQVDVPTSTTQVEGWADQIIQEYMRLDGILESASNSYSQALGKINTLKEGLQSQSTKGQGFRVCKQVDVEKEQGILSVGHTTANLRCLFKMLSFCVPLGESRQSQNSLLPQIADFLSGSKRQECDHPLFVDFLQRLQHVFQRLRFANLQGGLRQTVYHKVPVKYLSSSMFRDNMTQAIDRTFDRNTLVGGTRQDEAEYFRKSTHQVGPRSTQSNQQGGVEVQVSKSKRIRFLQRIDQDYYKMLKQTLKMEKEYTRSNYAFVRRFKRDKYVKRDNICHQKQFESSFSVLWSHKQSNHSLSQSRAKPAKSLHQGASMSQLGKTPLGQSLKLNRSLIQVD